MAREHLEEDYHRLLREQPRVLTEAERAQIRQLAADIPSLWAAETTSDTDRAELIRQVVDEVVVEAERSSERVHLRIRWAGGGETTGLISRPIRRNTALSTYEQICQRVAQWTQEGLPAVSIAERLNGEGYRPARGTAFGVEAIHDLRRQLELTGRRPRARSQVDLSPDEWWGTALAQELGIPKGTLEQWVRRGWVRARQEPTGLRRWIIWADASERERLRELHRRPIGDEARANWLHRKGATHVRAA